MGDEMVGSFLDEYKNLGHNIAYYRKQAHLTQEGLALKANLSRGYLSQIEAENVEKAPSLEMVFNIAAVLKIPVYKLFMRPHETD